MQQHWSDSKAVLNSQPETSTLTTDSPKRVNASKAVTKSRVVQYVIRDFTPVSPGAVRGEVDLLPPPSPAANWTSALPTLPSSDSSLVFSFNGSTHVAVVPDSVAAAVSGDHFTLQLWMRRGGINTQPPTNQARGNHREEETIVCSTVKNGQSNGQSQLSVKVKILESTT